MQNGYGSLEEAGYGCRCQTEIALKSGNLKVVSPLCLRSPRAVSMMQRWSKHTSWCEVSLVRSVTYSATVRPEGDKWEWKLARSRVRNCGRRCR